MDATVAATKEKLEASRSGGARSRWARADLERYVGGPQTLAVEPDGKAKITFSGETSEKPMSGRLVQEPTGWRLESDEPVDPDAEEPPPPVTFESDDAALRVVRGNAVRVFRRP
jgi:hypothetical protein